MGDGGRDEMKEKTSPQRGPGKSSIVGEPEGERPGTDAHMEFSRTRPTRQFGLLAAHYASMHADGYEIDDGGTKRKLSAEEAFPGNELPKFIEPIKGLVVQHGAKTILDYGSGKGRQYRPAKVTQKNKDGSTETFDSIQDFWGVDSVRCYDPGVPEFAALPDTPVDGVVCTDVLEHCYAGDVPWIVRELFRLSTKFVFANIACYPAKALLPGGENAHCTQRHPEWWDGLFTATSNEFGGRDFLLCCVAPATGEEGTTELKPFWLRKPTY